MHFFFFQKFWIITRIHGWGSLQSDLLVLLAEVIKPFSGVFCGVSFGDWKMTNTEQVLVRWEVYWKKIGHEKWSNNCKSRPESYAEFRWYWKVAYWDPVIWMHSCPIHWHQTASVPLVSSYCVYGKSDVTWMQHKPDWYIYSLLLALDAVMTVYIYPDGHTEWHQTHNGNRIWLIWITCNSIFFWNTLPPADM